MGVSSERVRFSWKNQFNDREQKLMIIMRRRGESFLAILLQFVAWFWFGGFVLFVFGSVCSEFSRVVFCLTKTGNDTRHDFPARKITFFSVTAITSYSGSRFLCNVGAGVTIF